TGAAWAGWFCRIGHTAELSVTLPPCVDFTVMEAGVEVVVVLQRPVMGSTGTGGMLRPLPVMVTVAAIWCVAGFRVLTPALVKVGGPKNSVTVITSLPGAPTRTMPHSPLRKSVPMKVLNR